VAISPGSDIVLDVVRAADPNAAREARNALLSGSASPPVQTASASAAAEAFDQAFGAGRVSERGRVDPSALSADERALYDSYRKFEGMVLQTFVKSMLPSDAEEIFGSGTAGEIWKGMMAEQLGTMIAKGGGIGIAGHMMGKGSVITEDGRFVTTAMEGDGDSRNLASSLLHELQRTTLNDWSGGEEKG
jgi:peptidoglycan hydrolase FlgJ